MFYVPVLLVCLVSNPTTCERHTLPMELAGTACRLPAVSGRIDMNGTKEPVTVKLICQGGHE